MVLECAYSVAYVVTQKYDDTCVPDTAVLRKCNAVHTDLWMLGLRLKALHWQLHGDTPKQLRALRRQSDTAASKFLAQDLVWAWRASVHLRHLPDPTVDWRIWYDLIGDKKLWYMCLEFDFDASRYKAPPPQFVRQAAVDISMRSSVCDLCPADAQRVCKSVGTLAVHKARTHGVSRPEKVYLQKIGCYGSDGTFKSFSCPVCLKKFLLAPKAVAHITDGWSWSTRCAKSLTFAGEIERR